jgi:hypothetical protein
MAPLHRDVDVVVGDNAGEPLGDAVQLDRNGSRGLGFSGVGCDGDGARSRCGGIGQGLE